VRALFKETVYLTVSPAEAGCLLQAIEFRVRYLQAKLLSPSTDGRDQIGASLSQLLTMQSALKAFRGERAYRTPATHAEIPESHD